MVPAPTIIKSLKNKLRPELALLLSIVANLLTPLLIAQPALAMTSLTEASIRLDRVAAGAQFNTTTGYKILVVLRPTTVGAVAAVRVTWPTTNAFTVDSTAANWGTSTTGLPTTYNGHTLTSATVTGNAASDVTGGAVTFDVSNVSNASNYYAFFIVCSSTTCLTNPTAGNAGTHVVNVATLTSGDAVIDYTDVAVDTVGTNADQVTLTASIAATFNFALSGNSIALGTLSTSAHTRGSVTIDVDTNASNGYAAWIRSQGAAATLASATTGDAISSTDPSTDGSGSPVTASTGSEAYIIDVGKTDGGNSGGTLTISTEYNGGSDNTANGSSTAGGVLGTGYEPIAGRTGVADSDTLTLEAVVDISAVNKAASDYTDTWEVVGAGDF